MEKLGIYGNFSTNWKKRILFVVQNAAKLDEADSQSKGHALDLQVDEIKELSAAEIKSRTARFELVHAALAAMNDLEQADSEDCGAVVQRNGGGSHLPQG